MKRWLVLLSFFILISCSPKTEKIPLSFYYWQTTFQLSELEQSYLSDLDINKMYIRYFDVDIKDNQPIPIAPIVFNDLPENIEIVPVVYLKNEVFLTTVDTKDLARKIIDYIQQINNQNNIEINQIQLDCDWSLQTRDSYFELIDEIKKIQPSVSATIRLHQIKYADKTGVPAVDKGVLMYYNMGVIAADENNSIYQRNIAKRYLSSVNQYSLPLDIALPIFSWGVHIRDHQVINLIGGMRAKDLQNDAFKKIDKNQYLVVNDLMYEGRYLAKNDIVKIEEPTASDLQEMVDDLQKNGFNQPHEIILYDFNEQNLTAYEKEVFQNICRW